MWFQSVVSKRKLRFVFVVVGLALALTLVTLFWPGLVQGAPNSPLTPHQLQLVVAKQQAMMEQGARAEDDLATRPVRGRQPVKQLTFTVHQTAEQALADIETAWMADQAYIQELERNGFGETAAARRAEYEAQKAAVAEQRSASLTMQIPAVKVGRHSITFSNRTYSSNTAKDPVNLVFYRVGSSWDVNYDLINWTRLRWGGTTCGGTQRLYIWDAVHSGGWDGWRNMNYQLQRNQGIICGTARHHLRLFGSFVRDSHSPSFGWWSVGGAHHDNLTHTCPDSWENTENLVVDSFKNSNGTPMWFVGTIWKTSLNNAGNFECAYNDGKGTFIELKN